MRPYWGQEQEPLHVTFVRQQQKRPLRSLLQLLSGRGDLLKEKNGITAVIPLCWNCGWTRLYRRWRILPCGERGWTVAYTAAGPISFLIAIAQTQNHDMKSNSSYPLGSFRMTWSRRWLPEFKVVSADFLILVEALKSRFGSSLERCFSMGLACVPTRLGRSGGFLCCSEQLQRSLSRALSSSFERMVAAKRFFS